MSMKPVMNEPLGVIGNAVNNPHRTGHFDSIPGTVTTMKPTGTNTNPANAGAGTTPKGPTPGA
jgi:hypothetical protein